MSRRSKKNMSTSPEVLLKELAKEEFETERYNIEQYIVPFIQDKLIPYLLHNKRAGEKCNCPDCNGKHITNAWDELEKHIILTAEPKVGKRILKLVAGLMFKIHIPDAELYMITALDRRNEAGQRKSFERYGFHTFLSKDIGKLIELVKFQSDKSHLCFYDESDYGSGEEQRMSSLRDILDYYNFKLVAVSATNQEAQCSDLYINGKARIIEYPPPPTYYGVKKFLSNKQIVEANKFFYRDKLTRKLELTRQGKELSVLASQEIGVSILRVSSSIDADGYDHSFSELRDKYREEFTELLSPYFTRILFLDAGSEKRYDDKWSHDESYYKSVDRGERVLLVINQTCTRSTYLPYRKYLVFLHDFRPNHLVNDKDEYGNTKRDGNGKPIKIKKSYGTWATQFQAFSRPFGHGEVKCIIACNKLVMDIAAGNKDMSEWYKTGAKISSRIKTNRMEKSYDFILINDYRVTNLKQLSAWYPGIADLARPSASKWQTGHPSKQSSIDLVKEVLNGVIRGYAAFYIDGPHPTAHHDSWERLSKEYPEWKRKMIVAVPPGTFDEIAAEYPNAEKIKSAVKYYGDGVAHKSLWNEKQNTVFEPENSSQDVLMTRQGPMLYRTVAQTKEIV